MASVRDYLDGGLGRELANLRERFQNQTAVDIETTEKIFVRLSGWARMFATAVGIPLGILAAVFALLGWKSASDVNEKAREVEAAARKVAKSIHAKEVAVDALAASFRKKEQQLSNEIESVRAKFREAATAQRDLRNQLERVEERVFQYERSRALTPELERTLNDSLDRYEQFLEGVGFVFQAGRLSVFVDPGLQDNAFYESDKKRIVLSPLLALDSTVVYREFTHFALSSAIGVELADFAEFNAVESGLADYFACSFTGDPKLGEALVGLFKKAHGIEMNPGKSYIRTMDNDLRFSELASTTELYQAGETLGGALWEIRRGMDAGVADRLVFAAWRALASEGDRQHPMEGFAQAMVKEAARVEDGIHVPMIETVFARRGLELAHATP